jgi:TIR domain
MSPSDKLESSSRYPKSHRPPANAHPLTAATHGESIPMPSHAEVSGLLADALEGAMSLVRADGGEIATLRSEDDTLVRQTNRTRPVLNTSLGDVTYTNRAPETRRLDSTPSQPHVYRKGRHEGGHLIGLCWERGEPLLLRGEEFRRLPGASASLAPDAPWYLAAPIFEPGSLKVIQAKTRVIGVILVWNLDPLWSFSARDIEILSLHCDRVARALFSANHLQRYQGSKLPAVPSAHMPASPAAEIRPLRIFVSYSRADTDLADQLESDLKRVGLQPWVDRQGIEGGHDWLDAIQHAIEQCDALVVILTPQAVGSEFVRIEWRHAKRMRKKVVPLLYKLPSRMPMDLAEIQWVDFQHDRVGGLKDLLVALNWQT